MNELKIKPIDDESEFKRNSELVNASLNLVKYYTTATVEIEARGEKVRPQDVNLYGSLCEARKIVV